MPPLWFVEGLAEYWSSAWDTQGEMVMRDVVLNGLFVSLAQLDYLGGYLVYKEGQEFFSFLSRNYGEDKILSLMENFWRFNKFSDVIEFTLGEKISEIDNKWIYETRQKYFPLYKENYPHTIKSKKITNSGFNYGPRFFRRGDKNEIYFIGNHSGYTSLMKLKYAPDSSEYVDPETIIEGEQDGMFEAFHLLENTIAISKNGTIAFVTKNQATDVLHVYSIENDEIINTLRFDGLIRIKAPNFSLDGNLLLFSATDTRGFSDLYIYNFRDNGLTRLTNDYYEDIDPIFNEDASKIIFSSDRTDGLFKQKYNLFEYDLSSKEIAYLTNIGANISTPHFSPDYKELYFTSDYNGVYNIWKIPYSEKKAAGMTQVTNFITSLYDFSFVDSQTLVTSAFENLSFQFYSLDLENQIEKKYVSFAFDDIGSIWTADRIKLNSEVDRLKYENEYTLDYAVSQLITDPVYGTRGGALITLSDMLSDDRYIFYIYNTAEIQSEILQNFNIALSRVNLKERSNYGYGVFNY